MDWAVKLQDGSGRAYEVLPEELVHNAAPSVDFGALVFRDASDNEIAFYGPGAWVTARRYEESED